MPKRIRLTRPRERLAGAAGVSSGCLGSSMFGRARCCSTAPEYHPNGIVVDHGQHRPPAVPDGALPVHPRLGPLPRTDHDGTRTYVPLDRPTPPVNWQQRREQIMTFWLSGRALIRPPSVWRRAQNYCSPQSSRHPRVQRVQTVPQM